MNAPEALTRLIEFAALRMRAARELVDNPDFDTHDPKWQADIENTEVAISICTAMLNTILPIVRFRCYIENSLRGSPPKKLEYTVCAVRMEDILSALKPLGKSNGTIRVSVFEQFPGKAEMISGYGGYAKSPVFTKWLKDLPSLESMPTVQ